MTLIVQDLTRSETYVSSSPTASSVFVSSDALCQQVFTIRNTCSIKKYAFLLQLYFISII